MTVNDLILENLRSQRVSGAYCDLKIELGSFYVWAHSAVVCPFSRYLELYRENFIIKLNAESECLQCLEHLLDVMYGLDVDLPVAHLDHALEYCSLLMLADVLMEPLTRISLDVKPPPTLNMVNFKLETDDEDILTSCNDYIEFEDNKHETFIRYQGEKRKMGENDELGKNKIIKTSHKREDSKTLSTHLQTMNKTFQDHTYSLPLTKETSQDHVDSHLPFPCSVCGSRFKFKVALDAHTAIHTKNKTYACLDCDESFKLPSLMKSHIAAVHPWPRNDDLVIMKKSAEKKLCCLECDGIFSCVDTLYRHLQFKKYNSSVCSICDRTLPEGETLEEHLPLRHSQWAPLICAHCDFRFKQKEELALHIRWKHGDGKIKMIKAVPAKKKISRYEGKKLSCLGCDFKCSMTNYLYRHLELTNHSSGMCSMCNWALPDGEDFQQHLLSHAPFICPVCNMRFTYSLGFTRHVATHTENKTHICTVCNKGFKTLLHLKIHAARMHSEAKHLCDLCGYSTRHLQSLRWHKQKHSGVPPLRCDYPGCSYTAYYKRSIVKHQTTHADNRPFVCDLCGKAYKRKHSLDMHQKCHGDKPKLRCSYCSFEICASRKSNLRAHMKRRHPDAV